MMDSKKYGLKDLDLKAMNNEPLPDYINAYEETYFILSRSLYQQYNRGEITLDQAKQEKKVVLERYQKEKELMDFFLDLIPIKQKLVELRANGFDTRLELEILELMKNI